jgi:hypothetical protein
MRRALTFLGIVALVVGLGGPAGAQGQSPVRHEPGGMAHGHFVVTPTGCVDIHKSVFFLPGPGPHLAGFASSGFIAVEMGGRDPGFIDFTRGIWHDIDHPDWPFPTRDDLC